MRGLLLMLLAIPAWADASTPAPEEQLKAAADELWDALLRGDSSRLITDDKVLFDPADPLLDGPSTQPKSAAHFEAMPRARFIKLFAGGIRNFQLHGNSPFWRVEKDLRELPKVDKGLWMIGEVTGHDVGPGDTRAIARYTVFVAFHRSGGKLRAAALLSKFAGEKYYK
jgi:hypothetical protein